MKKKILFVITKSNWGGAQRYVFDLATNLPKEQFEVMVALGGEGILREKLEQAGIRTLSISNLQRDISLFKEFSAFLRLMRLFRTEKPDIVHLNSSKAGTLGALAARFSGMPRIIFTAHGWPFREKRNALWVLVAWLGSWTTALFAHTIIAVSETDHRVSPFPSKTVKILNGIALPNQPETHHKEGPVIGTIAELTRNKGIDILLRTLPHVSDISLTLVGGGEEKERLQKLAGTLGIGDRVTFLGYVENAAERLSEFDIFVLPSRKEGLPYTLLEAGAVGLPVVATNVGGVPEIIEHEKTGLLVPPENPQALAGALNRLIKNPAERFAFGGALKQKVEREFSFDQMLERTAEMYSKI